MPFQNAYINSMAKETFGASSSRKEASLSLSFAEPLAITIGVNQKMRNKTKTKTETRNFTQKSKLNVSIDELQSISEVKTDMREEVEELEEANGERTLIIDESGHSYLEDAMILIKAPLFS